MNDALPEPMLTGPVLAEGPNKSHPCSCFTDPIDGSQWGVSIEPFTDPQSGLNSPFLIWWGRASAAADWKQVHTFNGVIHRCPPLHLVATLRQRRGSGGFKFTDPDYLEVCAALGLNPDPDPLFGGRPPYLAY